MRGKMRRNARKADLLVRRAVRQHGVETRQLEAIDFADGMRLSMRCQRLHLGEQNPIEWLTVERGENTAKVVGDARGFKEIGLGRRGGNNREVRTRHGDRECAFVAARDVDEDNIGRATRPNAFQMLR